MTEIRIPDDLWDTEKVPEGAVSSWLFEDGEEVTEGSSVATVMAEKTEYDIPAPASGTLSIKVAVEEAVTPGTVIGTLE
jgi:pyruvate/2-oxoglutarate dehydrogenase complex dihydrolipoamide acyltransferase (E2) component